jgi:hypothetical protein
MRVQKQNPIEPFFHAFVTDFGGEVLPEAPEGHTADYLFRKQLIIGELKTLSADQTDDMNRKLAPKVREWVRKNGQLPPGISQGNKYIVTIRDMPREIQDFWLKILKASVDSLVRDAHRQIRDTKNRMGLPSGKGLLFIGNQSNVYHDHPDSFRRLIAEVLRKRTSGGDLRYPHINAVVYFSLGGVKSRDEGMPFWANLQMRHAPDEDVAPMVGFQKELQQAFYHYIEKVTGVAVRQHAQAARQA